jgi:hypothetical protein
VRQPIPRSLTEASIFFTQNLSALGIIAKLERPLDSHAPQTEQLYTYEDNNWEKTLEDEYEDQWETSDEQYHDAQDNFTAEVNEDDDNAGDEQESPNSDDGFDEDDRDRYV